MLRIIILLSFSIVIASTNIPNISAETPPESTAMEQGLTEMPSMNETADQIAESTVRMQNEMQQMNDVIPQVVDADTPDVNPNENLKEVEQVTDSKPKEVSIPELDPDDVFGLGEVSDAGGGKKILIIKDEQGRIVLEKQYFHDEKGKQIIVYKDSFEFRDYTQPPSFIKISYNPHNQAVAEEVWEKSDTGLYDVLVTELVRVFFANGRPINKEMLKNGKGTVLRETIWFAPPNHKKASETIRSDDGILISEISWWTNGSVKEEKMYKSNGALQAHNIYNEAGLPLKQVNDNIPEPGGMLPPGMAPDPPVVKTETNFLYDAVTGNLLKSEVIHYIKVDGVIVSFVFAAVENVYDGPDGKLSHVYRYGQVEFEDPPTQRLDLISEDELVYAGNILSSVLYIQHYYHWKTGARLGSQPTHEETMDDMGQPIPGGDSTQYFDDPIPNGAEKPIDINQPDEMI